MAHPMAKRPRRLAEVLLSKPAQYQFIMSTKLIKTFPP